ncbi:GFA family protein [Henriciella aquimarina]|uniref:GFA family protein n=1 Tax=Henriciella aquimarina TaxID=545261 RepID=UPI000A01B38B|nr:hypothetical protein [Henriciella aquimarina]
MTATCLCGAVSVTIEARPDFVHDCNCSLCRKVGAAWGYFPSAGVRTRGETASFMRRDKPNAGVEVHACKTCAATTHFALAETFKAANPEADLVGVNMKLFAPEDLDGVEVRYPNGRDWDGVGAFEYRRPAMTISTASPW